MATYNTGGNLPALEIGQPITDPIYRRMTTGGNLPADPMNPANGGTGGVMPPNMYTMSTGGNLPADPVTGPITGGNLPPNVMTATGGPITGGNLPPIPVPTAGQVINGQDYVAQLLGSGQAGEQFSPANVVGGLNQQLGGAANGAGIVQGINGQFQQTALPSATQTTLDSLNQILGSGSPYMQNAVRRGLETAGARGLLNSSIASGAAQRSAIESSMPILNQAMGLNNLREGQNFQALMQSRNQAFDLTQNSINQALEMHRQRESQAFQGQQNQLNRTQEVNNQLLASQLRKGETIDNAKIQDWLNNQTFTREFNGALSMLPITSAVNLTQAITNYALQDPELYTPTVVSGMTEFFNRNMQAILQQYFGAGGTP